MKQIKPRSISIFLTIITLILIISSCNSKLTEYDFEEFMGNFNKEYIPLKNAIQQAEFNAATTGSEESYLESTELNIQLINIFSNKSDFNKIKDFKNSKAIKNPIMKSEINFLYNQYLYHQLDKDVLSEIITESKRLTKKFSIFRTQIDNELLNDNQVEDILSNTLDSKRLEKVWKASKMVGSLVSDDLIALIIKKNEAARTLGFKNYFEMKLKISGHDPKKLEEIYEGFNVLTEGIYTELKTDMDERLAMIYSIPTQQLMPWHYQNRFFQKAPNIYNVNLDKFYEGVDQVQVVKKYFKSLGLELDNIINNSDLYDRPGKIQAAKSYDINRNGDVRVVMNLSDNEQSMNTLLYEAGFSLYLNNISKELPYILREPSHFCTNDAVAVLFSHFSSNPAWLKEVIGISSEDKELICTQNSKYLALTKLVFSRWAQVMYHFEKEMYENPTQNLNKLWWQLVEKYQKINKPKNWDNPDWATKNHIITMPCTYHNYILGELYAAQLYFYIKEKITKHDDCEVKCINNPEVGEFLIDKVFRPGKSLSWEELIKYSTGEELDPDYFKRACINIASGKNSSN